RPARHDPHARSRRQLFQRQRVLVVERPPAVIHRRIDGVAVLEAEEDSLLDPGVDTPAERRMRIGLGRADGAGRQRLAQARERRAHIVAVRRRAGGGEARDVGVEWHGRLRPGAPEAAPYTSAVFSNPRSFSTFAIFCFDSGFGETIGRRYTSSSRPIAAIAAFTGIGFASTKLISISGRMRVWIARAAAKSPRSAA